MLERSYNSRCQSRELDCGAFIRKHFLPQSELMSVSFVKLSILQFCFTSWSRSSGIRGCCEARWKWRSWFCLLCETLDPAVLVYLLVQESQDKPAISHPRGSIKTLENWILKKLWLWTLEFFLWNTKTSWEDNRDFHRLLQDQAISFCRTVGGLNGQRFWRFWWLMGSNF